MATAKTQEVSVATAPLARQFDLLLPEFEVLDPNPDLHVLFAVRVAMAFAHTSQTTRRVTDGIYEYNALFFDGKLAGCEVKWSGRMTLCEPLLRLRPRSDMINTLLHEMIHAYVFVFSSVKDHDDHGAVFQSHMHRINQTAGTHISVFHSFHDEVDSYRQHWWKCDGPCQRAPPYYGIVKRAMNRPPGPTDRWWEDHQKQCGGSYEKIKDPPGFKEKQEKKLKRQLEAAEKKKKKEAAATPSVKNFFQTIPIITADEGVGGQAEIGTTQASQVGGGGKVPGKKLKGAKTPAPASQKGRDEKKPKVKKPRIEKPANPSGSRTNPPSPSFPALVPPTTAAFPIPSNFSGFPVVFSMGDDEFYLAGDIHALFQSSSQTSSVPWPVATHSANVSTAATNQIVDLTFSDDDDEEKSDLKTSSSRHRSSQTSSPESQPAAAQSTKAEVIEIE